MNTIGTRIRKLREEHGIKQEIIASALGITQSSYGRLEKNDDRLSATKLQIIADTLKVSVAVLFGEKNANIIHENNGDNAQANIGTLIQQDKEYISALKDEIDFLRSIIKKQEN
ncbi:MAG: helix-turn-helix domain-containing protein [Bacteroidales bacterium]|jgi:transcriptional regulator with XRE-family HTH domain|nr:helix-turn-helix domain-containing protein [Bacteroidales bacterium]